MWHVVILLFIIFTFVNSCMYCISPYVIWCDLRSHNIEFYRIKIKQHLWQRLQTHLYKLSHTHTLLTCSGVECRCWRSSVVQAWAWQLRSGSVGSELVCAPANTLLRKGWVGGWRCWPFGGSPVAESHLVKRRSRETGEERSQDASGLLLSCGTWRWSAKYVRLNSVHTISWPSIHLYAVQGKKFEVKLSL